MIKKQNTENDIIDKFREIHSFYHELETKYHGGEIFINSWNNYICSFGAILNQIKSLFKSSFDEKVYNNYEIIREEYFSSYFKEVVDIRNEITHNKNQKIESASYLRLISYPWSKSNSKEYKIKFSLLISLNNSETSDVIVQKFFKKQEAKQFHNIFLNDEDYQLALYRHLSFIGNENVPIDALEFFKNSLLKLDKFVVKIFALLGIKCTCGESSKDINILDLDKCCLPLDKVKHKIYEKKRIVTL